VKKFYICVCVCVMLYFIKYTLQYYIPASVCVCCQNEMMTGTYTQNPVISRITLALMEDTGFVLLYVVVRLFYHLGLSALCGHY